MNYIQIDHPWHLTINFVWCEVCICDQHYVDLCTFFNMILWVGKSGAGEEAGVVPAEPGVDGQGGWGGVPDLL